MPIGRLVLRRHPGPGATRRRTAGAWASSRLARTVCAGVPSFALPGCHCRLVHQKGMTAILSADPEPACRTADRAGRRFSVRDWLIPRRLVYPGAAGSDGPAGGPTSGQAWSRPPGPMGSAGPCTRLGGWDARLVLQDRQPTGAVPPEPAGSPQPGFGLPGPAGPAAGRGPRDRLPGAHARRPASGAIAAGPAVPDLDRFGAGPGCRRCRTARAVPFRGRVPGDRPGDPGAPARQPCMPATERATSHRVPGAVAKPWPVGACAADRRGVAAGLAPDRAPGGRLGIDT